MQYGTVSGRFLAAVADTNADTDRNPDEVPLVGKVTFTAELPKGRALQVIGQKATILPVPIVCTLDSAGYLSQNGARTVNLIATDTDETNPRDFTYRVTFTGLTYAGIPVSYGPFSIKVPAGQSIDLSVVAPVSASNGVPIIRGEAGPPGRQGDPGRDGRDGRDGTDGLPGVNAVDNDTAVATYLRAPASASRTALTAVAAPRSELVRVSAATLPHWTRKKQLAALGQGPLRVLCLGDSTTAGVYSDSFGLATGSTNQGGPNAYPARLAANLTALGIPAVVGMAIPGHEGNNDSRWSQGLKYAAGNIGAGANASLALTAAVHNPKLTPGVKADTYVIYYYGDSLTGVFSAQATGGAVTNVATAQSGAGVYKATVTAPNASAANALVMQWVSGTSFVLGVEFWDSTNASVVRVLPAGVGSSQAAQWANAPSADKYGGRAFIKAVAPDLTIMSLGINDIGSGRTPDQVMADVAVLAVDAAVSGDVLLVSAFPHPRETPLDAVNDLYYASTYPYVDLAWRYGHNMMAWGLMTGDQTHPNGVGYSDAAMVIAGALR